MRSIFFAAVLLAAVPSFATEYLVKYRNQKGVGAIQALAQLKSGGVSVVDAHAPGSYYVIDVNNDKSASSLDELRAHPDVEWVVENFQLHAVGDIEEKTTLRPQWALDKVNAARAWARAGHRGRSQTVVAVIDTGMDYRHKNLVKNAIPGYDFLANDADPMDETGQNPGHGTHCGGIIAADGNVEGGTIGIAPDVSLMPIRFLGANGSGDLNNAIKAIDFAIEKHVDVISASWGASVTAEKAKALTEAVRRADEHGVIFVAAAANDGRDNDVTSVFPANANFPNTITVAASNSSDGKPRWSNFGRTHVHLASPGDAILSTLPGDKYGNLSGTSMATPLVSGLVALLKSQDPSLTGAQIKALLQTTGAAVDIETACRCRVDAFAAVDALLARRMWMVPAAATLGDEPMALTVMNGQAPFAFSSSAPSIVAVDASTGAVTAVGRGTARITVTDARGETVSSSDFVAMKGSAPGTPPPSEAKCPFSSPKMCGFMCKLFPKRPYCQKP